MTEDLLDNAASSHRHATGDAAPGWLRPIRGLPCVRRVVTPRTILFVAFEADAVSALLLRINPRRERFARVPVPSLPRFHIAEMVDDIELADLRLLRTAFSLAEVTAALRDATGIADLDVALAESEIIDALLAGTLSRRQIGSMTRSRKLTTSVSARDLAFLLQRFHVT